MKPTIRERLRWWKWLLIDDDFHKYAGALWLGRTRNERNENLRRIQQRRDRDEPWPRWRKTGWVFPEQGNSN